MARIGEHLAVGAFLGAEALMRIDVESGAWLPAVGG
jgi:hypothetical protein